MTQINLYVAIRLDRGSYRVSGWYQNNFIKNTSKRLVFTRNGKRYHVVNATGSNVPLETIKRLISTYHEMLTGDWDNG